MPSSYTPNNGIEQPAIGSQAGTWGSTLNNDFSLIDQALDGVVTIDITNLSAYTLNIPQGASGNGRCKLIRFTGDPTVTTNFPVTVTPNSAQKIYFVQCANLFSVQVAQGSGNKYTVQPLCTAAIYCDGSGSGANVYGLFSGALRGGLQVESLVCNSASLDGYIAPHFWNSSAPGNFTLGDGGYTFDLLFGGPDLCYVRGPYSLGGVGNNLQIVNKNTNGGIILSPVAASGVQIGAAASAPTDSNLGNSTVTIYLDETGNNLKFRVRKSDGTYKTATLAMV